MRHDHRQRTVFQPSDAATPVQQPGKPPVPEELAFAELDQSSRGFSGPPEVSERLGSRRPCRREWDLQQ